MKLYGRTGLERGREHMSELARFLAARGIPLTVAVYPWPQQLQWNDRNSRQVTFWRDWAAAEHVRFVELFSDLFSEVDSAGLDRTIGRYYIPGDVHFNADGHALIGRVFLRRYCEAAVAESPRRTPLAAAACQGDSTATRASSTLLPSHASQ